MSYSISGTYVAGCSCAMVCGCPMDALPKDSKGGSECRSATVFHIHDGQLGDVDLSDTDFALYAMFPANLTSGAWTVGIIVDTEASDEQAHAIERIMSGQEGGPFGELAQFIGTYRGMERAGVRLVDGDKRGLSVDGHTEVQYEPALGLDGTATTVKNAMFGFAPEYTIGRTSGRSDAFGLTFDAAYGESAEFVYSTEEEGTVRAR